MKAGRNDPCPCGSGKKFKKCCLGKEPRETGLVLPPPPPPPRSTPSRTEYTQPVSTPAPARPVVPPPPPPPPDPITERGNILWDEFESKTGEDRIAVYFKTLEDAEVMNDDMAFEMLSTIHTDCVESNNRKRFIECVDAIRERRPEVFADEAHYLLSWGLRDALAEGWLEAVPALAKELAAHVADHIDLFNRDLEALKYHGQLSVLVDVMRILWPGVKDSKDIFEWAIVEFANTGADYEIFNYLEHTTSPDPLDPVLLERNNFFIKEPSEEYLREFIADLKGTSGRVWQTSDFAFQPPQKKRRDEWDDEADEPEAGDPARSNLSHLVNEFVGYLRREEGVPFPRGELLRDDLYRYFVRRHEGELDPRPSPMEKIRHPKLKLPKPPAPAHPLCPEKVTLEVHLAKMFGIMTHQQHNAAALFQAMPAWLRFLESRRLIDADTRKKVVAELLPLHTSMLKLWDTYKEDPTLYRQQLVWPEDAAKGPPEATA